MQEHRQSERVKSFLRAQIIYNNRMSTIDCVVKNISPHGAKVALGDEMSVPNEFDLYIPQKGKTFHARMAWRDAASIGVEFILPQANHSTSSSGEDLSSNDYAARLRALEMMNTELKQRVRDLSKRLEDLGQDPNIDV